MWAPVAPAVRTTSSAPSINVSGASSTMSRECVNVGAPALAANAATARYSAGSTPGVYPMSTPTPMAPAVRSVSIWSRIRASCVAVAACCHAVPTNPPKIAAALPSSGPPPIACMRAAAHDAEKP